MTNEELQKELDLVKSKLSKAHKENNQDLIDVYVGELNSLWSKASIQMLKNAENAGMYTPDKP
jgi:hypothetical protein|tara:strand:+ start:66 stop:254 length:189 start_codon:yes stop_codon:yes gene_type:complete